MLRRILILVTVLAAAALCSWPAAAAASDPQGKKAVADPQTAKKAAPETHAPKTPTAEPHAKKPSAESPAAKKANTETHVAKGAAADADVKKAASETHTAEHASSPEAHAPARKKAAGTPEVAQLPLATDLHAVNDRIQERLAEVRKSQAAKSSSGARAAAPRREARAASRPAPPRVELVWRPSVTWPQELQAGEKPAAAPEPLASERVTVAWGPQP